MERSGFFNSLKPSGTGPGDPRTYDETGFSLLFRGMATDGVARGVGGALAVSVVSGRPAVSVASGFALVRDGRWYYNDAALELTVALPSANARIDRVIVRLNTDPNAGEARGARLMILQGMQAASPTAPALIRAGYTYDVGLATYRIASGGSQVTNLTDTRGDAAVCGYSTFAGGIDARPATGSFGYDGGNMPVYVRVASTDYVWLADVAAGLKIGASKVVYLYDGSALTNITADINQYTAAKDGKLLGVKGTPVTGYVIN